MSNIVKTLIKNAQAPKLDLLNTLVSSINVPNPTKAEKKLFKNETDLVDAPTLRMILLILNSGTTYCL